MVISPLIRNIFEIGFGVLLLIGAIFNTVYTFRNGEEFYRSFVENALLLPARQLVEKVVIPRNQFFTVLMVIFQLAISLSILSRGAFVGPGMIAGGVFAFVAAWVSSAGGMIANLVMAIIMLYLGIYR
jgi:hypothetical protein